MHLLGVALALVVVLNYGNSRKLISSNIGSREFYFQQEAAGVEYELHVKFLDELLIRLPSWSTKAISKSNNNIAVEEIDAVLKKLEVSLDPLLGSIPEMKLNDLLARSKNRSGALQPDLGGIMRIVFNSKETSVDEIWNAANVFDSLHHVEYVHISALQMPLPVMSSRTDSFLEQCEDEPPERGLTPLYVAQQTYRQPDPGFDADYANDVGANGHGIRLSDCEFCWDFKHEDVYPLNQETGHTPEDIFPGHGIASVGVTKGVQNDFGITGVAREAEIYTYSELTLEGGYNRERAVVAAVENSGPGDVVLLEMQSTCCGRSSYSPAETNPSVWLATKVGTDAGVVVVAAAGNGNEDLDSSPYSEYMDRGDSGAILVGAGEATTAHTKASFSTYGSRINVQAWGDWSVMTAGYGVCTFEGSHERNRHYTNMFSGTSSASALVAGAVTALQSWAAERQGRRLTPEEMREVLMMTGKPQQDAHSHWIGPHINLRSAIELLQPRE